MEDAAAMPRPLAPPPPGGAAPPVTPWTTGLFGCMEDQGSCVLTFFCPCITFGRVAEIVDRGATSSGTSAALYMVVAVLTGCECQWIFSCFYRSKMRAQYGLEETPLPDCCVHFLCEPCAICQQYRELTNRGFAMEIGWQANVDQGRGGGAAQTTPPSVHGDGMTR